MNKRTKKLLTFDEVNHLVNYNPETGAITWKERDENEFPDLKLRRAWNAKYAGKEAGCVSSSGYMHLRIKGTLYYSHRVAWLISKGVWPSEYIDHINHEKIDNRISNLREASALQSVLNRRRSSSNKSGVKGVSWVEKCSAWQAKITKNRKTIYIEYFNSIEEAEKSISAKRNELHGLFACNE